MSLTLDMSKFNCVIAGRRLKNISEFQRSDDGEKGTVSDPDIYGNVVYTKKKNKMAEFEVTVLNRTDDHDLLEKYYQEDAAAFREEGQKLFGDKMLAFRTELELISDH